MLERNQRKLGTFKALPDESLLQIFSLLKRQDIANLKAVNHNMRSLCNDVYLKNLPYAELDYSRSLPSKMQLHGKPQSYSETDGEVEITAIKSFSNELIAVGFSNGNIEIWDLNNEKGHECIKTLKHPRRVAVDQLLVLENGWLISGHGGRDTNLLVWSPFQKKTYLYNLSGHTTYITGIEQISASQFATASWDASIRIWDLDNDKEPVCSKNLIDRDPDTGGAFPINHLKKLTTTKIISSHAVNNTVVVWDLSKQENQHGFKRVIDLRHQSSIYGFDVLSENIFIIALGTRKVFIGDLSKNDDQVLTSPSDDYYTKKLSKASGKIRLKALPGNFFASTGPNYSLMLWKLESPDNCKIINVTSLNNQNLTQQRSRALDILPDGRLLSEVCDGRILAHRFQYKKPEADNDQTHDSRLSHCSIL